MPRLLLFGPCQKAIIDQDDALVSMIAILAGVTVAAPVSLDAAIQFPWAAVAVWERLIGDEDKAFEQQMQVVQPDDTTIGDSVVQFTFVKRTHQNVIRAMAFPVGQAGLHSLRLSIREVGSADWSVVAEYPVEVEHRLADEAVNSEESARADAIQGD
jgi:hypothetical protein